MDIKGSGVIHPPCPSSIIENILMEIDQLNINNNHFEGLDINLYISNNVKRSSLETIREEHQPPPHRERGQHQHPPRSWHRDEHQQDQRELRQDTWHGWHFHPRQRQPSDSDLASQRPIGGRTRVGQLHPYRGNNISDHLRVHPRHLELQHHPGQDSKMEDIAPGSISTSSIWRHLGMLLRGHLRQPR